MTGPAKIVTGIIKWIGWPGIVGLAVYFFFVGVPVLNWWPVNAIPGVGVIVEGEMSRRIESHDRKRQLRDLARAKEAERALGERAAARAFKIQQRMEADAQARVDLAIGIASEREQFLGNAADNQRLIENLKAELAKLGGSGSTCEPEVIIRHVEKIKTQKCGYPGDALPSDSFLQQYRKLGTRETGSPTVR